jgi:hypothetical protein
MIGHRTTGRVAIDRYSPDDVYPGVVRLFVGCIVIAVCLAFWALVATLVARLA